MIFGLVEGQDNVPIAGAELSAISQTTGKRSETESDSEGKYAFPASDPGLYTITVKARGYQDEIVKDWGADPRVHVDFNLKVGGNSTN